MAGIMKDGFSTVYSFADDSVVQFKEKEVTPPGVSAGGVIDTTTMQNAAWRTMTPKQLKTLTEASAVVVYDPAFLDEAISMVGSNQLITITFPDLSTWVFWGVLDEFTPGANVEGEQPTADITIIPTNTNDLGAEVPPAFTATP